MAGKQLRCDHDGCEHFFPEAPVAGYHWPIRATAEKAGWRSTRYGLYDVDAGDDDVKDYCPIHVGDLTRIVIDLEMIDGKLTAVCKDRPIGRLLIQTGIDIGTGIWDGERRPENRLYDTIVRKDGIVTDITRPRGDQEQEWIFEHHEHVAFAGERRL